MVTTCSYLVEYAPNHHEMMRKLLHSESENRAYTVAQFF